MVEMDLFFPLALRYLRGGDLEIDSSFALEGLQGVKLEINFMFSFALGNLWVMMFKALAGLRG